MRQIVYFETHGIRAHMTVISIYALAGIVVTLAASLRRARRARAVAAAADSAPA